MRRAEFRKEPGEWMGLVQKPLLLGNTYGLGWHALRYSEGRACRPRRYATLGGTP